MKEIHRRELMSWEAWTKGWTDEPVALRTGGAYAL